MLSWNDLAKDIAKTIEKKNKNLNSRWASQIDSSLDISCNALDTAQSCANKVKEHIDEKGERLQNFNTFLKSIGGSRCSIDNTSGEASCRTNIQKNLFYTKYKNLLNSAFTCDISETDGDPSASISACATSVMKNFNAMLEPETLYILQGLKEMQKTCEIGDFVFEPNGVENLSDKDKEHLSQVGKGDINYKAYCTMLDDAGRTPDWCSWKSSENKCSV